MMKSSPCHFVCPARLKKEDNYGRLQEFCFFEGLVALTSQVALWRKPLRCYSRSMQYLVNPYTYNSKCILYKEIEDESNNANEG